MKKIAIFWILFCFTIIVIPSTSLFKKDVLSHDSMINITSNSSSKQSSIEKSELPSNVSTQSSANQSISSSISSKKETSSSQSIEQEIESSSNQDSSNSDTAQLQNDKNDKKQDWRNITHFNILNISTNKIQKVSVQDYVRGAVTAELPPTFHEDALKSQAVSAHTYALMNTLQNNNKGGYDFTADPDKWRGYVSMEQAKERFGTKFDTYWGLITKAVDSVINEVLVYDGEPILAAYHAISSGKTEFAENVWTTSVPYLQSVESEGDLTANGYKSTITLSKKEVEEKLLKLDSTIKLPEDPKLWFSEIERSEGGYILSCKIGKKTVHGKEIRSLFNLRSSNIKINYTKPNFTFEVVGYGHGVGLSQVGADYMARQGSTYKEILLHYYQGATLEKVK